MIAPPNPPVMAEIRAALRFRAEHSRTMAQLADIHGLDALRDAWTRDAERDETAIRLDGTVDLTDVVLTLDEPASPFPWWCEYAADRREWWVFCTGPTGHPELVAACQQEADARLIVESVSLPATQARAA